MMALLLTIMALATTSVLTEPVWEYVYTDRHGAKHFVDFQSVKAGEKNTVDLKVKIQFAPVGEANGAKVYVNAISYRIFSSRLECFNKVKETLSVRSYDANGREIAPIPTGIPPVRRVHYAYNETDWSELGFARACSGGI